MTTSETIRARLDQLRERAQAAGFPDVLIGGGLLSPGTDGRTTQQTLDEGYDFLTAYNQVPFDEFDDGVYPYETLVDVHERTWSAFQRHSKLPYIPFVTSGWDPRPWYGFSALRWERSPEQFGAFLRKAQQVVDNHANMRIPTADGNGQKMVLIYAWNEMGEGGHILPTVGEQYKYLEEIKAVFDRS